MKCCAECFGDRGLKQRIFEISDESGKCDYCESDNQDLIAPQQLQEYFEPLVGIYSVNEGGKLLTEWFVEDWALFCHEAMDKHKSQALLSEILNDGEIVRKEHQPIKPDHNILQKPWSDLVEELRHTNRYFPDTSFDDVRLSGLFQHILFDKSDSQTKWFRSRVVKGNARYSCDEMGAPPKEITKQGRANPAGIPYLYLSSETKTCVAEVRPQPGEIVCVAEFNIPDDVQFVDLRSPRSLVSPFLIGDETLLSQLRGGDIKFLESLGCQLTTPVLPDSAAIEYTGSQYLCEFIKKCGYHGVIYSSSVSTGYNLALFYPNIANVSTKSLKQYRISKVDVSMSPFVP